MLSAVSFPNRVIYACGDEPHLYTDEIHSHGGADLHPFRRHHRLPLVPDHLGRFRASIHPTVQPLPFGTVTMVNTLPQVHCISLAPFRPDQIVRLIPLVVLAPGPGRPSRSSVVY